MQFRLRGRGDLNEADADNETNKKRTGHDGRCVFDGVQHCLDEQQYLRGLLGGCWTFFGTFREPLPTSAAPAHVDLSCRASFQMVSPRQYF